MGTGNSALRTAYICRLIGRIVVLLACAAIYIWKPQELDILNGMSFFSQFSIFHLLWLIWVIDMTLQLFPIKHAIPLGSQKLFKLRFKPIREKINREALRNYITTTTQAAYKVMVLWVLLLAVLGWLHHRSILSDDALFLVSVTFYVCDLICVLVWCPFRLLMKTRCCTTCRIFNWDHLMMFTPMLFVKGFFSRSLLLLAILVWGLWELFVLLYPERFWEKSNAALQCTNCTDKLCTQYCRKLRK